MEIVLFVAALAIILLGAELFTNGIEWLGHRLGLADGAVGSVLAAVATALPETLIPIIAIMGPIFLGTEATAGSEEVGVGAILGAPFMLATLAMFVTGIAVLVSSRGERRSRNLELNTVILGRDFRFFLLAYAVAIGAAFIPEPWHWVDWLIAAFLLVVYALYVRAHFRDEPTDVDPDLNRLHVARLPGLDGHPAVARRRPTADGQGWDWSPRLWLILVQTAVALGCIILGARVFVTAIQSIAGDIGMDPRLFALIVAPIATELPEKFNSIIWVRAKKDTLALGNITGAMVFQSCIPIIIGLLFTPWLFTPESALSFLSAGAAVLSTLLILGPMARGGRLAAVSLLVGGPIYAAYVLTVIFRPFGLGA